MPYTQENRLFAIDTPLGEDVLLLDSFSGSEGISRLFTFHLDLLSENMSIAFTDLIGQSVTISLRLADDTFRYFNGIVSRFSQSGTDAQFARYHMEVVPWLWLLTRRADCRIFQNMSVTDIIKAVFAAASFSDFQDSTTADFDPTEYCVQYRETDFNFVSRLMEQYGIFYYFSHEDGKHTMVLGNTLSNYQDCPGQSSAGYALSAGGLDTEDVITSVQIEQELRTGKYTLNDYNFLTPSASLLSSEPTVVDVGGNSAYELYDYPGDFQKAAQGTTFATIRMQEEETGNAVVSGSGDCRAFTSGYKFELTDYYRADMNITYLLTEIQHVGSSGSSYSSTGTGSGSTYSNHFACISAEVPYRPSRKTPKPFVQGPQTALVVGKSGEEIWVDSYGRVKVQFYWDRVGQKDENSSCWLRVSQAWAGQTWGSIVIPRIGQEVIVAFLEGDPDRPIITGCVYNATQTVPYALPDNQTRSTFLSRSSKGGASANANELRFEDKKGSEQIFINAEFDMDQNVENDYRENIAKDRSLIVGGKQSEKVTGDFNSQVGGDSNTKVTGTVSLQAGENLYEKSGQNYAHQAGQAIHLKAGMTVVIEAGVELTLKAGSNFVNIGPAGVAIVGTMVMINSGGAAGSGSGSSPKDPVDPDKADDGSKGTKLS